MVLQKKIMQWWRVRRKLAISHADAVVQGSEQISPSLADFIAKSGKPFLAYPGAEHPAEVYNNFYEQL